MNNTDKKQMGKGWLEAFSDGVIAIAISIVMLLELKVAHGAAFDALMLATDYEKLRRAGHLEPFGQDAGKGVFEHCKLIEVR